MTIQVKHPFVSAALDLGNIDEVGPDDWNATHTIQLSTGVVVGRTTAATGDAEEIPLDTTAVALIAGSETHVPTSAAIMASDTPVATSGSGTVTLDLSSGRIFFHTLTGNCTFANMTNQVAGAAGEIYLKQDGTGGWTASWGANFTFLSGLPTIPTAAAKYAVIPYRVIAVGTIICDYKGQS